MIIYSRFFSHECFILLVFSPSLQVWLPLELSYLFYAWLQKPPLRIHRMGFRREHVSKLMKISKRELLYGWMWNIGFRSTDIFLLHCGFLWSRVRKNSKFLCGPFLGQWPFSLFLHSSSSFAYYCMLLSFRTWRL